MRMAINRDKLVELRTKHNLSQTDLAREAQVSQQLIGALETGAIRTTKALPKIAKILQVPVGELDPDWAGVQGAGFIPEGELVGERDLPVYAVAEGGGGTVIVSTDPVDWVKRPAPLATVKGGYGLLITGESMIPRYRPGDVALVNPHLQPRPEDGVVLYAGEPVGEVKATIKEFVRSTDAQWVLKRYRPKEERVTLSRSEWPVCHVVVGVYSRR